MRCRVQGCMKAYCIDLKKFSNIVLVRLLVFFFLLLLLPGNLTAATITVSNNNDTGAGSLRQAIIDAGGGDTIDFDGTAFPDPATGTIVLTSGELVINKALTISGGNNVTIDGNDASRIFNIDDGIGSLVNVSLSGLILTNGNSGSAVGGAILNRENLTLDTVTVSSSTTTGNGGGLYNDASAVMGVVSSTISGNSAASGGGIYQAGASLNLDTVTVNANSAGSSGGGIYTSTGTVTVSSSSIIRNTAASNGGGAYFNSTTANISNSTISSKYSSAFCQSPFIALILESSTKGALSPGSSFLAA